MIANSLKVQGNELLRLGRFAGKWLVLAGIVGVLAGTASAIFLISLDAVTAFRVANPGLIVLLPPGGWLLGWLYHRFGGAAGRGSALIFDQVNEDSQPIPRRMTVFVLGGTLLTHLFGGSAGREGTAVQMGASLADGLRRLLPLAPGERRLMLLAGISGGFASVFGTPAAGFVFGLESQRMGRVAYDGALPCLIAALVGDLVTRAWGVGHTHYPLFAPVALDALLVVKVVGAGVAFGLASRWFIVLTDAVRAYLRRRVSQPPLRLVVGGIAVVLLTIIVGTTDYNGLSIPLIVQSVHGDPVPTFAFLLKIIFTALTLGAGFVGGEVTPLFAIGATLGASLGAPLGVDPALMASLGFVAVFAGASNTPLACALMGVELFGGGALIYIVIACSVAYLVSGHRGIYSTQRVAYPKHPGVEPLPNETLHEYGQR